MCVIVFLLIITLSLFILMDNKKIISEAESSNYKAYKPVKDDTLSFNELKNINNDVIGWITIDNTSIDYPLAQGETNETYINKSIYGDFSLTGAIFLDSRNSTDPTTNTVSIIYGHNMVGDAMFGGIDLFEDLDYFNNHLTGTLFINEEYYKLDIFSFFKTNGYNSYVYNTSINKDDYNNWVNTIVSMSVNRTNNIPQGEPVLLLSTCSKDETDGRCLLAATISEGYAPLEGKEDNSQKEHTIRLTNYNLERIEIKYIVAYFFVLLILTVLFMKKR